MNKIIKYGWRLLLLVPLMLAFGVYVNNGYKTNKSICPNDFENTEKRTVEFQKWIDNFYEDNPNASTKETIESRRDFLAKNKCVESLKINNLYITTDGKVVEETNKPICPDDFKDHDQELASFVEWAKEFWGNNPNATISDFSQARVNFWRENNCTQALKRYDDYMVGNIDKETQQLIEMVVKQEIAENKRIPVCPDEYANQEDYIKATEEWLGDFYDKNQNTTKDEMLSARMKFLIQNGCKELPK